MITKDNVTVFLALPLPESRPGVHEAWPALPSSLRARALRGFRLLLTRTGLILILILFLGSSHFLGSPVGQQTVSENRQIRLTLMTPFVF